MPLLGVHPREMKNVHPPQNVYANIHSNIIHNSPQSEDNPNAYHGWMDKQSIVHPYNGFLFSKTKEWSTDTCYMNELSKHYA